MGSTYWRELFCYKCGRVTKHQYYIARNIKINLTDDHRTTKEKIQERLKEDPFEDPNIEWTCWVCKSKNRISTRRKDNAFITLKIGKRENLPETDSEKIKYLLDRLAEVISSLEDRIEILEGFFPLGSRKRGIKLVHN